jgi:hypothetical protein
VDSLLEPDSYKYPKPSRVTLRRFDHHVDFDFFISQTDALSARADFDRRNS